MSEKALKLTRRRALGALVTIGVGSAAAGAGTFAAFSDTENSTGNTVTAGTLDLGAPTGGSFDINNVAPGDSVPSSGQKKIKATYNGSIDAVAGVSFSLSEPSDETTSDESGTNATALEFADKLNIDTADAVNVTGSTTTDLTTKVSASNPTLKDLVDHGAFNDVFGDVNDGDTIRLDLAFTFDNAVGNKYQGDGVSITVTFTADQA